jgi:ribosomal protein S18 acetylase RimI-like enzyme
MSLLGRKIRVVRQMPGLNVRLSTEEDGKYWREWLQEEAVQVYYPMASDGEREESVSRMQAYARYKCGLTAEFEGEVAGIAYLNPHPYKKIAHHCLFTIIVGQKFQGKGIGYSLMEHLERMARESYGIKLLHLEVYEGNPAIRLYRRLGYREFGFQSHWSKEGPGEYGGKIFMQKRLTL